MPAAPAALARLWNAGLDMVFPPRCVACREFGAYICDRLPPAHLLRRAAPLQRLLDAEGERTCESCRHRRPAFTGARAAFVYDGPARDAVLALKFRGLAAIAKTMAVPMAERLLEWDPPVSAIVPVPLALPQALPRLQPVRTARPGNRRVHRLPVSLAPSSGRARRRRRSSARLEPAARNVARAFAPGRRRIEGGVLLVDDVITTGATLDACARVLHSAGSGPVFALTFARED